VRQLAAALSLNLVYRYFTRRQQAAALQGSITKGGNGMKRFLILAVLAAWACCAMAGEECAPAGGFNFICGPASVEDLVRIPGTQWIVGSGMAQKNGRLHLINAGNKTWEIFYPGTNPVNELDAKSYNACPGAPDPKTFVSHGIAIRDDGRGASTLLSVNHGREAIEVFKISVNGEKPAIRWVGCVPMSADVYLNSVAFLPNGGFVTTKFYDPKAPGGFGAMMAHQITGGVLEWHSGTGVKPIAETELSGANGIEVSKDGKTIFVAAWGSQELVRFSFKSGSLRKDVIKVGFSPDNLRWAPDGKILVAGQNGALNSKSGAPGFKGWTVIKLDPETLKITEVAKDDGRLPLQNASVAIDVDGTLWIGTFAGNRVAYR
jgi:hypothetical protein